LLADEGFVGLPAAVVGETPFLAKLISCWDDEHTSGERCFLIDQEHRLIQESKRHPMRRVLLQVWDVDRERRVKRGQDRWRFHLEAGDIHDEN
jgi:hypothetical protein